MKSNNFKKLSFNKTTIIKLSIEQQTDINGGVHPEAPTEGDCYTSDKGGCVPTEYKCSNLIDC